MYDGKVVNGPSGVRSAVLKRPEAFIRNFTEKLLAYGLGRVLDHRDMPNVRSITRMAAKEGNSFSSFVMGIVQSPGFQMSKRPSSED